MKKTIKGIVGIIVWVIVTLSIGCVILGAGYVKSVKAYNEAYRKAYVESYREAFSASYEKAYREEVAKRNEPVLKTETYYEYRDGVKWTVDRIYFEEN